MLTSSTSFQGVLPVKTYRGRLCQTFENDPKIWKAEKFVANFCFLFVNEPSSMSAMENFESTISSNRQATTPAFSIFKNVYSINFYIIKTETMPWEARVARR